jgi:serine/threonine protein phosphatase 1
MSDLHGHYRKYLKMLDRIGFNDDDDLYILGDVVDWGPQPMELLCDMSMRMNVFPVIGNHDLTAALLLKKLNTEITEDNYANHLTPELLDILAMWRMDGGKSTLDGFSKLSAESREAALDYLDEFLPYETLEAAGNRFILAHGGIPFEKRHLPLSGQSFFELVSERPDYTKRYYNDAYLITGHTPTFNIGDDYRGRIYRGFGHIAIDCGAGFGLPLGCIRLDDFEEFYVD